MKMLAPASRNLTRLYRPCASSEEKVERVLSTFPLCDRTQIYSSKMASNIDEANVEEKRRTENEAGE